LGPLTTKRLQHSGHFTCLPSNFSGTAPLWPQSGHSASIVMVAPGLDRPWVDGNTRCQSSTMQPGYERRTTLVKILRDAPYCGFGAARMQQINAVFGEAVTRS